MKILSCCVGVLDTNCYIVYDEESLSAVVIDPGNQAEDIMQVVEENHLHVTYVMLTHGHFDHILAAHEILQKTGAKYVVPEKDLWLLDEKEVSSVPEVKEVYVPDQPDILAQEGTELTFGTLTAHYMNTPGHTPGSSVIRIGDALFTGDTLFAGDCGRCDFEGGNPKQMMQSLERLHDLEGDYQVLPGHDDFSTLETERKNNVYMIKAVEGGRKLREKKAAEVQKQPL